MFKNESFEILKSLWMKLYILVLFQNGGDWVVGIDETRLANNLGFWLAQLGAQW